VSSSGDTTDVTGQAAGNSTSEQGAGTFVERIGEAVATPMQALVAAESEVRAGKSPTDAALLMLISFAVIQTAQLATTGWLLIDGEFMVALQTVPAYLARAVSQPLVFLLVGAVSLTVLAGRRRSIGKDIDLACVAFVPLVVVQLVAALAFRTLSIAPERWMTDVVGIVGYVWAASVLLLALRQARRRPLAGQGES